MTVQVHHRIPRRLLKVWDGGHGSSLEPEDLAAWIEWEEAYRYGGSTCPRRSYRSCAKSLASSRRSRGAFMHPSAWNINSANFAFWDFSEGRNSKQP
jgi:hypothetical protein